MLSNVTVAFLDGTHRDFKYPIVCRTLDDNPDLLQIAVNPENPILIWIPLSSIKYVECIEEDASGRRNDA